MNIAVIGTLDTKGQEVAFIRDAIRELGHTPLILDPGVLGAPAIEADISRTVIAEAGGYPLLALLEEGDKAHAQEAMTKGLIALMTELHRHGKVQGVIAVGGAQGTATATAAMQALPIGVPKVMVSTVACGRSTFGPYVGTKDVTMIHSVADILGLNAVTRRILSQASAAVVAMASVRESSASGKPLVAITQAGITTPGVMRAKDKLEGIGFEVIAFHCNGIGGQAMEDLIREGTIKAVIDFSPHEITDMLFGGLMPALPGRMSAAGSLGIPQVVAPGATDIRLYGAPDELPEEVRGRPYTRHTPTHSHVRASADEMAAVAAYIAEQLNNGKGPRAVMVPLRGYSAQNQAGKVLYDEKANNAFVERMRTSLSPDVELLTVNAHINDPEFADAVVTKLVALCRQSGVLPA